MNTSWSHILAFVISLSNFNIFLFEQQCKYLTQYWQNCLTEKNSHVHVTPTSYCFATVIVCFEILEVVVSCVWLFGYYCCIYELRIRLFDKLIGLCNLTTALLRVLWWLVGIMTKTIVACVYWDSVNDLSNMGILGYPVIN